MNNQYLEILNLAPGASKTDVKRAYRLLSKRYHPDVSKDENAREKFIIINEAYKFLTEVGPRPSTITSSAQSYDYDIRNQAHETWRRKARVFAQKQAREAIRRQNALIKSLLRGFDVLLIIMVFFNGLLLLDRNLPSVAFEASKSNKIVKSTNSYFDIIEVNNHTLHLMSGALDPVRKKRTFESAIVYATPILDKSLILDLTVQGKSYRFFQSAGVYGFYEFLIKMILLVALFYKVVVRSLDSQLSFAVLLVFMFVFQLAIFI